MAAQESRLERGSKIQDSTRFWDSVTQCNFARKNARAQGDVKVGALWPSKLVVKTELLASKWARMGASLYLALHTF